MPNVIVIDTDAVVRRYIVAALTRFGCAARETDCPVKASQIHSTFRAALIITEVILRMPAEQALRLLRGACPEAKLLLMTGVPGDETLQRWNRAGFYVLIKPFGPRELEETLRRIFREAD